MKHLLTLLALSFLLPCSLAAQTKLSDLIEGTSVVATDLIPFVDVSDTTQAASGSTKKATALTLANHLAQLIAPTWNNGATDFTAFKVNVTNTASGAGSKVFDFKIGGTSYLNMDMDGIVTATLAFDTDIFRSKTGPSTYWDMRTDRLNMAAGYYLGWTSSASNAGLSADTRLYRGGAGILAQRNGTSPQEFQLYNTYTDASNYERGFLKWDSNVLKIGTAASGTGTVRTLRLQIDNELTAASSTNNADLFYVNTQSFCLGQNMQVKWGTAANAGTGHDLEIERVAAGVLGINDASSAGAALEMQEMTAPSAPAANKVRIYAEDNGAGKTFLRGKTSTNTYDVTPIQSVNVYHVSTTGNDTTGDGSLNAPFLTAQKAYDVGVAATGRFKIRLGKGSFTITSTGTPLDEDFQHAEGEGYDLTSPADSLTILSINQTPGQVYNAHGTAGAVNTHNVELTNLRCIWSNEGGPVVCNDSIGEYTGGTGGTVKASGNCILYVTVSGGTFTQSNNENGIGGTAGVIDVKDAYLEIINNQNGEGWDAGSPVAPTTSGSISLKRVDAQSIATWGSVSGNSVIVGSSVLPATITPLSDKGGNSFW